MNRNGKFLRRIALVILLGAAVAGCASGPSAPSPELLQQIAAARTPSDHEALAVYYERKATETRLSAKTHQKMAESYQGMYTGGRGSTNLRAQHSSIVGMYESIATQYDGLAGEHRRMAAHAQP